MVRRNLELDKLPETYLFAEMARRVRVFQSRNPSARLLSLGVGDTTEPLPSCIDEATQNQIQRMSTRDGYAGYGDAKGEGALREKIAETFYPSLIDPEEVFVSDGAKCDIGRLQFLFGEKSRIGVQDPAYPVYVDATILARHSQPRLLPCTPANNFFPDLSQAGDIDILYFCAPNNPTGAQPTYSQLEQLVAWAKKQGALIIYDSAYSAFVQEGPRSIYEIPGATSVAIETGSFSKLAGFTGMRLGWCVVPGELKFADGQSIRKAWTRVLAATFNGSSRPVQAAGLAVLSPAGLKEVQARIAHYLGNARLLREALEAKGIPVYGGEHAPYLWADFPTASSWEAFEYLLNEAHLITTPGVGFGPSGEGFLRLSAFGSQDIIREASIRLKGLEVVDGAIAH